MIQIEMIGPCSHLFVLYLWPFSEALTQCLLHILGEVELENLPLRRDALRNLGLPLQALSGTVGKIKLQIPVRQFRTAPWCILIENVYVVVGPVNLDEVILLPPFYLNLIAEYFVVGR